MSTPTGIENVASIMRMIQSDCENAATRLDSTPFTPRGMGETFGAQLAMIKALARAVELLADEVITP